MADLYFRKGQILEIIQGGAISKGKRVTVLQDYTADQNKKGETVKCDYDGRDYWVTNTHLKEVSGVIWRKGQDAKLISGGAISRGNKVIVLQDFTLDDLKRGRDVKCSYQDREYQITPHHLGALN